MSTLRNVRWVLLGLWILVSVLPARAYASSSDQDIPPDFKLVTSGVGVQLFRKDYSGGNPDFVQVIDLTKGARIALLHGDIDEPRLGRASMVGMIPV